MGHVLGALITGFLMLGPPLAAIWFLGQRLAPPSWPVALRYGVLITLGFALLIWWNGWALPHLVRVLSGAG